MSLSRVNPSPDILKLQKEGYEVEIRGAHLLVSHVPYVDSSRTIQYGVLVCPLRLAADKVTIPPPDHVVHFAGSVPCHKDGSVMTQIQHPSPLQTTLLGDEIVVNRWFSHKPSSGYPDYYSKMTGYIEVISAPAMSLNPKVKAKTFKVIEAKPEESVFNYLDTNSSRADIEAISDKLKGRTIGIVGLGGTGSYVLDLVAKTPVDEIHLFDGDEFAQHNAFRAPGAPSLEQLLAPPPKVAYFAEIYSRMRRGIHPHAGFLDASNVDQLRGLGFAFVCIDDGRAKKVIVEALEARLVPFIDVGMGVHIGENNLWGMLRTTTSTPGKRDHLQKLVSFDEGKDDEYATNIQIAELNMLNAALAVIKWKKLCGFYQDLKNEHDSVYSINVNQLLSDEIHP
jgi:hypothetical protein